MLREVKTPGFGLEYGELIFDSEDNEGRLWLRIKALFVCFVLCRVLCVVSNFLPLRNWFVH